jgi:hypothetical protein
MKQIIKKQINFGNIQSIELPVDSELLNAQFLGVDPYMIYLKGNSEDLKTFHFSIVETGKWLPKGLNLKYVTTFQNSKKETYNFFIEI